MRLTLFLTFSFLTNLALASEGGYVVQLRESTELHLFTNGYLESSLSVSSLSKLASENYFLVNKKPLESKKDFIARLKSHNLVKRVEPNILFSLHSLPDDELFAKLWGLENTGQSIANGVTGTPGVDIGARSAWAITKGSRDVLVAVIDTGINLKHPDLQNNIFINTAELNGLPGVDDDQNGYVDDIHGWNFSGKNSFPQDDNGHGTHVAGTIGAEGNNSLGVVGVNWRVSLLPLKSMDKNGAGTLAQAIEAIQYALKMKVNIINASWGSPQRSDILEDVVKEVAQRGVLFVASAGNSKANNDIRPTYPAGYETSTLLSVAAIDGKGELGSFSNWGWRSVPVAAPGVSILSTMGNGYRSMSGTSMAAPHVSGVAALLLSENPLVSAEELKNRIILTAVPVKALDKKIRAGLVHAENALLNKRPERIPEDPYFWLHKKIENFSTPHPYKGSSVYEYTIEIPEAKKMSLYFKKFKTEKDFDKLSIYDRDDKKLLELSGSFDMSWTAPLRSNYLRLELTTSAFRHEYGFDLTEVAYE